MESTRTFCSNLTGFTYEFPADEDLANPIKGKDSAKEIILIVKNALILLRRYNIVIIYSSPRTRTRVVELLKARTSL